MKKIVCLALLVIAFGACKKDKEEPSTGTGNISGLTRQVDQFGNKPSTLDNVTVSLDNDDVTTTTNSEGNFTLAGVKPGIYTIFFSKPGCKPFQISQVNFPGNGTYNTEADLIETPTFNFQSADITVADSLNSQRPELTCNIHIKMTPVSKPVQAAFVYSSSGGVDMDNLQAIPRVSYVTIPANTSDFSITKALMTVSKSSAVYLTVYPYSGSNVLAKDNSGRLFASGYGSPLPVIKVK